LGRYWIIFQWIEAQLDKLLLLAWGHENWARSQKKLARMTNAEKIQRVELVVLRTSDFARVHTRPEWVSDFKSVLEALQEERKRRNAMIHSQILFEFADKGLGPPLLSTRLKPNGEGELFEQHWLSKEFQKEMMEQIGTLAMRMNFIYIQLVHDFQAPTPGV
jgi:hypothetical protein